MPGVANSTLVSGGDVTTTLFVTAVEGDRRLGRCVVGTGRPVNKGGTVILLLVGAFISVPPAPVSVEKRRASGGVHTHASIVHNSTDADVLDVRYVVTLSKFGTRYTVSSSLPWLDHSVTSSTMSPLLISKPAGLAERSEKLSMFISTCHIHSSRAGQSRALCSAGQT